MHIINALRVGERQSWVKCLVQEHNVAAAGSDGSSLPTQSHFTATPGDQAFESPSGFESPTLSITSSACYHLRHSAPLEQVDHQSNILDSTEMVKTTRKTKNKMER